MLSRSQDRGKGEPQLARQGRRRALIGAGVYAHSQRYGQALQRGLRLINACRREVCAYAALYVTGQNRHPP
jgi:hypothetical protein